MEGLREYNQAIAAQRVTLVLKRAADLYDVPMSRDQANGMAREIIKDIPALLQAMEMASEGKVR